MGNASAAMYSGGGGGGGSPRSKLQLDFPKVVITSKLAEGKFLKSYRCKFGGVGYVIKVFLHRESNEDVLEWCKKFAEELSATCSALDPIHHPNLLPYQHWMLSAKQPGYQRGAQPQRAYLIREYVLSNLYDRLSTRPFLTRIEKYWIIFQLLKALSQCHSAGICHGDLKSENILVTSFNWVFVTDFAPFKPTYILDDDPAEFYYYFQSQNRARCYVAPERFYSCSGNDSGGNFFSGGAMEGDDAEIDRMEGKGDVEVEAASSSSCRGEDMLDDDLVDSISASDKLPSLESTDGSARSGKNILCSPYRYHTPSVLRGTPSPESHARVQQQQQQYERKGYTETTVSSSLSRQQHFETDRERGRWASPLTEAMDIFSLGCVIAEVFLDGEPLMDLPDALQYRAGSTSPDRSSVLQKLDKVDDDAARNLILHMLSIDPHERKTAQEYLTTSRMVNNTNEEETLFPSYFEDFLYPLMAKLQTSTTTPDERLELICDNYGAAMNYLVGVDDEEGCNFFNNVSIRSQVRVERKMKRVEKGKRRKRPDEKKGKDDDEEGGVTRTTVSTAGSTGHDRPRDQHSSSGQNAAAATEAEPRQKLNENHDKDNVERGTKQERQRSSSKGDNDDMYFGVWSEELDELLKKSRALLNEMGYRVNGGRGGGLGSERIGGGGDNRKRYQQRTDREQQQQQLKSSSSSSHHQVGQVDFAGAEESSPSGDDQQPVVSEGLIFVAQVVCSTIQHLSFPQNKVLALCLLSRFGCHCDDEARLQLLIPYMVALLEDPSPIVRATSVRCIRSLLLHVRNFPASDEDIFPLYIFPALQRLPLDSEELVRVAFAECLPILAETSKKFLDTTCTAKLSRVLSSACASSSATTSFNDIADAAAPGVREGNVEGTEAVTALINTNYDQKLSALRKHVARWFILLLSSSDHHLGISGGGGGGGLSGAAVDSTATTEPYFSTTGVGRVLPIFPHSSAKFVLLREIPRLCPFLGYEGTLNSLLPQLIAMLNDRDWVLRAAFCEHIPAVCAYVGHIATAEFILPCIENALVDSEEFVTCKAVLCLETLLKLGLLSRHYILDLLPGPILPLLAHPGVWPREATVGLVVSVSAFLGPLDSSIFLLPILTPYLRYSLDAWGEGKLTTASLKKALRPPISKVVFQMAIQTFIATGGEEEDCNNVAAEAPNSLFVRGSTLVGDNADASMNEDTLFPIFHPIEGIECNELLVRQRRRQSSPPLEPPLNEEPQQKLQLGSIFPPSCDGMLRCLKRYIQAVAISQHMNDNDRVLLMRWYGSTSYKNLVPEARSAANRWKEHVICLPTESLGMSAPRSNEIELLLMRGKEAVQEAVLANPIILSEAMGVRSIAVEGTPTSTGGVDDGNQSTALVREERGRGRNLSLSLITDYGGVSDEMILAERTVALGVPPLPPPLNATAAANNNEIEARKTCSMSGLTITTTNVSEMVVDTMASVDFLSAMRWKYPSSKYLEGPSNHRISAHQESYDGGDGGSAPKPYFGGGNEWGRKKGSQGEVERSWKYRRGVLVASLKAHSLSVNRLAIALNGSYFVSCSSDGTSCVWEVEGIEKQINQSPQPQVTYIGQRGRILDVCVIEGSQSLATVSSEGSVHVWRVETTVSKQPSRPIGRKGRTSDVHYGSSSQRGSPMMLPGSRNMKSNNYGGSSSSRCVQGATLVRQLEVEEGPIVSVNHMESASASTSVLVYATQMGGIRSWDLRDSKEPWKVQTPPELGVVTSVAVGSDKICLCVGTSRGFLTMYDIRFPIGLAVWRHSSRSPLNCMSTCSRIPCWESSSVASSTASRANVFIAAGNDVAVWDLNDCPLPLHCFRVEHGPRQAEAVEGSSSDDGMSRGTAKLPRLDPVPLPFHPRARLLDASELLKAVSGSVQNPPPYNSVRAMTGRISYSSYSYLITGGTDRFIRCWDLDVPSRCYIVSGPAGPMSGFGGKNVGNGNGGKIRDVQMQTFQKGRRLTTVFSNSTASDEQQQPVFTPLVHQRGLNKMPAMHADAITDLKVKAGGVNAEQILLSSSRDGVVNVWC